MACSGQEIGDHVMHIYSEHNQEADFMAHLGAERIGGKVRKYGCLKSNTWLLGWKQKRKVAAVDVA